MEQWAQFQNGAMVVIGAILGLFGLGIYHGALRLFGAMVGAIFLYLIVLSNVEVFQLEGWQHLVIGIMAAVIGGFIGSWLAAVFHYAVFFILGAILGYVAIWVFTDPESAQRLADSPNLDLLFKPEGWHWIAMLISGGIYLLASNWILLLTCAFVGGAMAANAMDMPIIAYAGIPLGILVQWVLFLRPGRPRPQTVRVVRKNPQLRYDNHGMDDEWDD